MPWRPLPRIAFGVCTYPFSPESQAELPLQIGDELYIIEQGGKDGSWYRGYLVAPPSVLAGLTSVKGQTLEARVFSGIFPQCCVEIKELLGDDARVNAGIINGSGAQTGALTPTSATSYDMPLTSRSMRDLASGDVEGIPVTSKLPNTKSLKLTKRISSQTQRSDTSGQQAGLPMSPKSGGASGQRDPDAPRPPAPVPMLKVGDETQTFAQEPLVDEIASCLREWYTAKLHELLLTRKYGTLDKMSFLVQKLDTSRRQLLHKILTEQELRHLREETVWDLVNGNKMLSGEVIVRSPSQRGRLLTAEDSPIEVTRLQSMMSLLTETPQTPSDEHVPHHLLVEFPNSFGELSSPKTIAINLCSKSSTGTVNPVSEVHALNISASGSNAQEGNMRTLFVDIGSADLGEGSGSGSTLYVAFKVIVNEALRTPSTHSQPRESISSNSVTGNIGSIKGGRKSLMWGKAGQAGPNGPKSLPAPEETDKPQQQVREQKMVKRTVAAAILRVDHIIKQDLEVEQELTFWASSTFPDESVDTDANWDQMIRDILPSASGEYRRYPFPRSVKVFIKPFLDPDADDLIKRTPTLLQNISQTRKIGFIGAPSKPRSDIYLTLNEVILPRNASLAHPKSGAITLGPQQGLANLQLTLEVRKSSGQRIENCIFPSCNSQGHTAWRTTACERGEPWNLTIRLAIPAEDVPGSHVVMSIADLPQFPFALCWMPLWSESAFLRDSEHVLSLYVYDEYTSSIISGRGAYLALPWQANKRAGNLSGATVGPTGEEQMMAALKVRTYLCSTKYSQDPTLLGLLDWKGQAAGALPGLLRRFSFVPEIEIVKLLPEVFDALFEVLVDSSGSEEYENLVFNDLVFVLGIVYDRRFRLAPLVDQYAEQRFKYPAAAFPIVRTFIRLLATPTDSDTSQKLRATFKVAVHLLRFVNVAWQQQEAIDRDHRSQAAGSAARRRANFLKDVRSIFDSLENLMKNQNPILVGTKTLVVQHFHSWLPELTAFMNPGEISRTAISFVDACNMVRGKLILYKLLLIIHLSQVEAINLPELKRDLRLQTVRWLAPYWGKEDLVTDQWKEQVRLCCSVVASQLSELGEEACEYIPKLVDSYRTIQAAENIEGGHGQIKPKKTLSLLFPTSYPFPTRPIPEVTAIAETEVETVKGETTSMFFDEAMVEVAAVLAGIISLPTTLHLDMPSSELAEFLFSALQVYISLLDGEAYPRQSWLSVHIFHHRSTLRSLEKLASVMIDAFLPHPDDAEQFNTELWRTFFEALLKLVGSESLALETFAEQKRRAVWKIAGDVREQGADLLRRTWEAIGWETSPEDRRRYGLEKLGGYQVQYVPSLVGPIVELCLTVHDSLRGVAIRILQTMIVSEWTLSGDLGLIQAEIIECLDALFKRKTNKLGEGVTQKQFVGELLAVFDPLTSKSKDAEDTKAGAEEKEKEAENKDDEDEDDGLLDAVKSLIATVDVLLDLLIAVHATDDATTPPEIRLMETLHLMEFLRDMQKVDIFIGYVHQLAVVQAQARNYTEAGLALRLHADLYAWDPSTIVEPLKDPVFPSQSAFERKEMLFFRMIRFYEDGHSWDNALASYMELADQYEHNVFDFAKLARAQRAMATIYEAIGRGGVLPLTIAAPEAAADGGDTVSGTATRRGSLSDGYSHPKYFRVVFRGFGFPVSLRDKQFIYQGVPGERLAAFVDRMQQQFAAAVVTAGSAGLAPEEERRARDVEQQYVHIYPVSPQKDINHPIYRRAKVAPSVRDYYLLSRPMSFTSTNRRKPSAGGADPKTAVVEKTVYTTAEAFPTVLKKSEIVEVESITLDPIQAAVERTTRKTAELVAVERKIVRGGEDTGTMAALTDLLMLSVDAHSTSTVAHYRNLLRPEGEEEDEKKKEDDSESDEEEEEVDDEDEKKPLTPHQTALKIALIDHALVVKRCLTHYARPAHQATGADLQQRFEETFGPEIESFTDPTIFGTAQLHSGIDGAADGNGVLPWSPMSFGYAGSTPPRTMSPAINQGVSDSTGIGIASPTAEAGSVSGILHRRSNSKHGSGAIGAAEKHRLSLTFLRRTGSVSNSQSQNGNGSPVGSGSTSPIPGRRTHAVNNSIDAQLAENSGSYPIQSQGKTGPRKPSEDAGGQGRKSIDSEKVGGSRRSRVGSVKKRLSLLGLANKDSKMKPGFEGVKEE